MNDNGLIGRPDLLTGASVQPGSYGVRFRPGRVRPFQQTAALCGPLILSYLSRHRYLRYVTKSPWRLSTLPPRGEGRNLPLGYFGPTVYPALQGCAARSRPPQRCGTLGTLPYRYAVSPRY